MCTLYPVLATKPYQRIRTALRDVLELGRGAQFADSILLREPGWTLHEFDFKQQLAVFIDVGAECELFTAGFSYQRQVLNAKRVATLNFEAFIKLAQALKPPSRLIHLFNIGHYILPISDTK